MRLEPVTVSITLNHNEAIEILADLRKGSKEHLHDVNHGIGKLHRLLQANFESSLADVHFIGTPSRE